MSTSRGDRPKVPRLPTTTQGSDTAAAVDRALEKMRQAVNALTDEVNALRARVADLEFP